MEVVTHSLNLPLVEKELYDILRSEKRQDWELLRGKGCNDLFIAHACSSFFP